MNNVMTLKIHVFYTSQMLLHHVHVTTFPSLIAVTISCGYCGCDCMVCGFTTTYAISAYHL